MNPALSLCDIPPFRFLYKVGRDAFKSGMCRYTTQVSMTSDHFRALSSVRINELTNYFYLTNSCIY
jgi:hypothetical protein